MEMHNGDENMLKIFKCVSQVNFELPVAFFK